MIYELLEQIEKSVGSGLYHVGLFTALTIPDIAGAIDSQNGQANGEKYVNWFDAYVAPKYKAWGEQYLTGGDCYQYRCAMLHQGRSHHQQSRYSKTIFLVAKQKNIAYCGAFTVDGGHTLCVDIPRFCHNVANSADEWLEKVEQTSLFKRNSSHFIELFSVSFGE